MSQTSSTCTCLFDAVRSQNISFLQNYIESGNDIDESTEDGVSCLHVAAGLPCNKLLSFLLEHGASPDSQTPDGLTPLHIAAIWGQSENIRILLSYGANPHTKDNTGCNALLYAQRSKEEGSGICVDLLSDRILSFSLSEASYSDSSDVAGADSQLFVTAVDGNSTPVKEIDLEKLNGSPWITPRKDKDKKRRKARYCETDVKDAPTYGGVANDGGNFSQIDCVSNFCDFVNLQAGQENFPRYDSISELSSSVSTESKHLANNQDGDKVCQSFKFCNHEYLTEMSSNLLSSSGESTCLESPTFSYSTLSGLESHGLCLTQSDLLAGISSPGSLDFPNKFSSSEDESKNISKVTKICKWGEQEQDDIQRDEDGRHEYDSEKDEDDRGEEEKVAKENKVEREGRGEKQAKEEEEGKVKEEEEEGKKNRENDKKQRKRLLLSLLQLASEEEWEEDCGEQKGKENKKNGEKEHKFGQSKNLRKDLTHSRDIISTRNNLPLNSTYVINSSSNSQPNAKVTTNFFVPFQNNARLHSVPPTKPAVCYQTTEGEETMVYDWKDCSTCAPNDASVRIPDSFKCLTTEEIKQRIMSFGQTPGPITQHTKNLYLKKLWKIEKGIGREPTKQNQSPFSNYPSETRMVLAGRSPIPDCCSFENAMMKEFGQSSKKALWRGGNEKSSFNYLLLDPRVTCNLPLRSKDLSQTESFRCFILSVFYVGKGKRSRPYAHLHEAVKSLQNGKSNKKLGQIWDIWNAGLGVISLHIFQNAISVEAFTREACMVEALGLSQLTNQKRGEYYGQCASLPLRKKRNLGTYFLFKACKIFFQEGERQICKEDL